MRTEEDGGRASVSREPVVLFYGLALAGKRTTIRSIAAKLNASSALPPIEAAPPGPAYDELTITAGERRFLLRALSYPDAMRNGGHLLYRRAQRVLVADADAFVLVVDGQVERTDAQVDTTIELREDLDARGLDLGSLPIVVQQNKTDLPNFRGGAALGEAIGLEDLPWVQTCARTGEGVFEVLDAITERLR